MIDKNDTSELKRHFLEAETREGYFVDAKMKKVWKCQLDIVEEFQRICKAHNLRYFAIGGTLIGAVRHKGYIPWDDDIDFIMMRDQYDLFCKYARKELHAPYFLQNLETDELFHEGFTKIRDPRTTQITAWAKEHKRRFNQGICIDIFPLDVVADRRILKVQHLLSIYFSRAREVAHYGMRTDFRGRAHDWLYLIFYKTFGNRIISRVREMIFRCIKQGRGNLVGPQAFTPLKEKTWWNKEWFSDVLEWPYEYLTVTIPKEYDKILTHQFGDWRKPVQGASCHTEIFFDTERPYTEYLKEWGIAKEGK